MALISPDHFADAYRNKYHITLTTNRTSIVLPDTYWHLYKSIQGFTKWDAQYFLEISNDGYTSEQHLAFFPLFPLLISMIKRFIFQYTQINVGYIAPRANHEDRILNQMQLENYVQSAMVGFALNNFLFFPIASISLFALTKLVKGKGEKYAKNVVWWFCFNPASVFFSACYTESLFALLTFTAIFILESRSESYFKTGDDASTKPKNPTTSQRKTEFVPLEDSNRLIGIIPPSLAFLALSTATRSNGLITIGVTVYQFLLKYAPLRQTNRSEWSIMVYFSLIMECFQDILLLLLSAFIASSGYIAFQAYTYTKFCVNNDTKKGALRSLPDWCSKLSVLGSHPYTKVQAKYWNVGLFQYYQVKQLPNFLLALPISFLVIKGSLNKSKDVARALESKRQIVYYLMGVFLTIFCGLTINVQVTTRMLASSCPAIYWICADVERESRWKHRLLVLYFISYFILGTILHTNFYPWT